MPIPERYLAEFNENCIYHIYNRTNNQEKLFLSDEDRSFFLEQYDEYLSPFAETYCWNLLPNHFHFLVRIKSSEDIVSYLEAKKNKDRTFTERKYLDKLITTGELIEQTFKRFFQVYAFAFNNRYGRSGNLFHRPFKRILVDKESQFTQAVIYIHANAQKHKIVTDFRTHEWSSWASLLSAKPTKLLRKEILDWFGGKDNMVRAHLVLTAYYYDVEISIEE